MLWYEHVVEVETTKHWCDGLCMVHMITHDHLNLYMPSHRRRGTKQHCSTMGSSTMARFLWCVLVRHPRVVLHHLEPLGGEVVRQRHPRCFFCAYMYNIHMCMYYKICTTIYMYNMPPPPPPPQTPGYNVAYVGNISFDVDAAAIEAFFGDCNVIKVRLHTDKDTGRSKGYAHVHFADEAGLDRYGVGGVGVLWTMWYWRPGAVWMVVVYIVSRTASDYTGLWGKTGRSWRGGKFGCPTPKQRRIDA